MKYLKHLYLPLLTLLLASLGCKLAARLSPINIIKTAKAPTLTTTPTFEDTVKGQATATLTATITQTPTSTPNYNATGTVAAQGTLVHQTAQAQPMAARVQTLKEEGYLSSTNGAWHKVKDFNQSWAETDDYRWWNTGYQPVDFIIQANAEWWSADATTYLFNAGCGFIFRAVDQNNFFAALLTLDGKARFDQRIDGEWLTPVLSDPVPTKPMNDRAQLMLIVEGNRLVFFKDDVAILDTTDANLALPRFQEGDLAIALRSGSTVGYGLRCQLTDIDLWIIR
jgi:hypothetical protein